MVGVGEESGRQSIAALPAGNLAQRLTIQRLGDVVAADARLLPAFGSGLPGLVQEKVEPLGTLVDQVVRLVYGLEGLPTGGHCKNQRDVKLAVHHGSRPSMSEVRAAARPSTTTRVS